MKFSFTGYGIATPKGSPWRDKISLAILELQEKGEIQMLYDKWWKNTGDTCVRKDKKKESKASALGVDSIGGVFVVLIFGLVFAICVSIGEFCYSARNRRKLLEDGGTMVVAKRRNVYVELLDELCFAFKCLGPRQRPAMKRDCSKCFRQTQMKKENINVPTTILTTALIEDNNKRYLRLRRGSSTEHQTGYCSSYCHSYSLSVSPSPSHSHHLRHVESFRVREHFYYYLFYFIFICLVTIYIYKVDWGVCL